MPCLFENLPLELWIAIATDLSLGDLSVLCEIFSPVTSLRSIILEQAIKNLYVVLLNRPVELFLTIPGGKRGPNQITGHFFRHFFGPERNFTHTSESKVSMTVKQPNDTNRIRYTDLFEGKSPRSFDIKLNIFGHLDHDACCKGCDVLKLQYKNVAQANNDGREGERWRRNKIHMHAQDMKLESAIWSENISRVEYSLPVSWFEGFGRFIRVLTKWEEGYGMGKYTVFELKDLSILFNEIRVPTTKDLLMYFPPEIIEK